MFTHARTGRRMTSTCTRCQESMTAARSHPVYAWQRQHLGKCPGAPTS